jgi:hypothetical protein
MDVVRVGLVKGRAFTKDDRRDVPPVAIVSQALARRAWPSGSAVSRRLKLDTIDSSVPWMTVVGLSVFTR